jgi:type IV pilus assembly protein PilB
MRRNFNPIVEKMLGQILVERNIISPRHLQMALDRQKKEKGKFKYIGEILIEMGIPQEKINEALDIYNKRKPIGQIFLDLKIITPDQLKKALEKQSQPARMAVCKPLGRLLVEMEFTTYNRYMDALSRHFNMAIVSLRGFFPSNSLQRAVGKAYAQKHQIVVLEDYSKGIKLALAEPDPLVMDDLRRAFPSEKRVEFCLADRFEIDRCLKEI